MEGWEIEYVGSPAYGTEQLAARVALEDGISTIVNAKTSFTGVAAANVRCHYPLTLGDTAASMAFATLTISQPPFLSLS